MSPNNEWEKQNFLDALGRAVISKWDIRPSFQNHPCHIAIAILLQDITAGWTSILASIIATLQSSKTNNSSAEYPLCCALLMLKYSMYIT